MPEAHIALGQALTFLRQHDAALAAVELAVALNPNMTSFRFGYKHVLAGQADRGAQLLENHMRLDPLYEPNALVALAFAYYVLGRYQEALPLLHEAISRAPYMAHGRYVLAMSYVQLGELDKATAEAQNALRMEPWYRNQSVSDGSVFLAPRRHQARRDWIAQGKLSRVIPSVCQTSISFRGACPAIGGSYRVASATPGSRLVLFRKKDGEHALSFQRVAGSSERRENVGS